METAEEQTRLRLHAILEDKAAEMARQTIKGHVITNAKELGITFEFYANTNSILGDGVHIGGGLSATDWKRFHSAWKRLLLRNGITRHRAAGRPSQEDNPACPWREVPGHYSISDPLNGSQRSREPFVLDVPRELGDKILVLGTIPG